MKKKILSLCLVIVLAATAIVGGTLAYFTDDDSATNEFTVGNVTIDLTEPNWDEEETDDVYPGERLAKDPTVENIGANPCFVRIKVTGLDQFVAEYGSDAMIGLRTDYVDGKLGDGWVEYNGYYYFTEPLLVKGTETDSWNTDLTYHVSKTDALFDQIVFPTEITNSAAAEPIEVKAEAVQAQGAKEPNWAAVKGMTVAEIAAWFTTCGL